MQLKILKNPNLTVDFWEQFDILVSKVVEHKVQLTSQWLKAYIKHYLKPEQVYIIAVFTNETLVGCLPLQINKIRATKFWDFRVLTPLGNGPSDFFDIPLAAGFEKMSVKKIVRHLRTKLFWDKLILNNIPSSSKSFKKLLAELKYQKINYSQSTPNGYYWVDTSSKSWVDFESDYFKAHNKDLYKSERRLAKDTIDLEFRTFNTGVYDMLMKHIDLYASRRLSLGQNNTYLTRQRKNFLKDIIELYEFNQQVELSILKDINGNVWAFQLDWLYHGVRYHWNHAYNENYKRYSPGKLLLKKIMISSFENNNIISCNHMRGLSGYKSKLVNKKGFLERIDLDNNRSIRIKIVPLISRLIRLYK